MATEEKTKEKIKEKIKLDKSYVNYNKIIEKGLPYKFAYLDEWRLKESNLLLNETTYYENDCAVKNYKTYKRGTIIKADFGVNLGSEMSQVHFAIVLNNYDNPKNNVLTVVPLTSKKGRYNLNLKNLVIEKLIEKVNKELLDIGVCEEFRLMDEKTAVSNIVKSKKLYTLISYYKSNVKNTYACCSLITTISKTRIFKPINEYDIVGKERCSDEVMNKIDAEIIKKFTKMQ